jgi:hypothetical protein
MARRNTLVVSTLELVAEYILLDGSAGDSGYGYNSD